MKPLQPLHHQFADYLRSNCDIQVSTIKMEQHPRKLNRNKSTRSERYGINYCSVQNSSSLAKHLFGSLNSKNNFPKDGSWLTSVPLTSQIRSLLPRTICDQSLSYALDIKDFWGLYLSILKSLHFHFIVNFGSLGNFGTGFGNFGSGTLAIWSLSSILHQILFDTLNLLSLINFSLSIMKQSNVSVNQQLGD